MAYEPNQLAASVRGLIPQQYAATIADGTSLSAGIQFQALRPSAIIVPSGVEGSAFSFEVSYDGITYYNLYNNAGEYTVAFVSPGIVILSIADFLWCPYLKLRTGTSGSPQNQTGDAALAIVGA